MRNNLENLVLVFVLYIIRRVQTAHRSGIKTYNYDHQCKIAHGEREEWMGTGGRGRGEGKRKEGKENKERRKWKQEGEMRKRKRIQKGKRK